MPGRPYLGSNGRETKNLPKWLARMTKKRSTHCKTNSQLLTGLCKMPNVLSRENASLRFTLRGRGRWIEPFAVAILVNHVKRTEAFTNVQQRLLDDVDFTIRDLKGYPALCGL
jgi:hypothetical protein